MTDDIKRVRLRDSLRARLVVATENETFEELADRASVSRNWLSMIYNGHRTSVRVEYADRIARALGTSVEQIAEPLETMADFGQLLKRFRRMRKMSQSTLASVMGMHTSKMSRIENTAVRVRVSIEQIESAVEALELTKTDADALMDAWAPLDLE